MFRIGDTAHVRTCSALWRLAVLRRAARARRQKPQNTRRCILSQNTAFCVRYGPNTNFCGSLTFIIGWRLACQRAREYCCMHARFFRVCCVSSCVQSCEWHSNRASRVCDAQTHTNILQLGERGRTHCKCDSLTLELYKQLHSHATRV